MSDLSLTACHVTVRNGGKLLLEDVSLRLVPGEFLGIVGPNGAGKTTLLKSLLGFQRLSGGHIFLEGRALEAVSFSQKGKKIAYLPQERVLPYGMKAEDVVALGRLPYYGKTAAQSASIVEKVIEETGLQKLRLRRVETLSGGEKARVCLARALAVDAPFLLVDEPTAALDPAQAIKMMEILYDGIASGQRAVCAVIHDLSLAAQFCTRITFLKQGSIIAEGSVKEVMTEDIVRNIYETDVQMVGDIPLIVRKEYI